MMKKKKVYRDDGKVRHGWTCHMQYLTVLTSIFAVHVVGVQEVGVDFLVGQGLVIVRL